jgi:prolyl-tRNA synthetase
MKDSYSFDVDDAGLDKSYQRTATPTSDLRPARLPLRHRPGDGRGDGRLGESEEFLATAESARTPTCAAATAGTPPTSRPCGRPPEALAYDDVPAAHVEDTPDTPTIESLVDLLNATTPARIGRGTGRRHAEERRVMLKHPDGTREPLAIGVPGDREVDEKRLAAQVEPARGRGDGRGRDSQAPDLGEGLYRTHCARQRVGLRHPLPGRSPLVDGHHWVTGANAPGQHALDVVAGRDFTPDGTIEAADVREGRVPAVLVGIGGLSIPRAASRWATSSNWAASTPTPSGFKVLDENGKLVTVTMGSYGIGPSRAVAAIAENTHDELGLCWPREIAPADVHVVAAGKDAAMFEAAEKLSAELVARGLTVIYDDRAGKVSPGVKFKDAELLGVPTIVTVGRGLADGNVEVRDRKSGERTEVSVAEAADHIAALPRT